MLNCKLLSTQAASMKDLYFRSWDLNHQWPDMAEHLPQLCVTERSKMLWPGSWIFAQISRIKQQWRTQILPLQQKYSVLPSWKAPCCLSSPYFSLIPATAAAGYSITHVYYGSSSLKSHISGLVITGHDLSLFPCRTHAEYAGLQHLQLDRTPCRASPTMLCQLPLCIPPPPFCAMIVG
jgi:hypothetical protein